MRRTALRPRRVDGQRGATLFVVVLAITLLTGIGLFTVHSSSLLARAAGNEREALQTAYLAELATLTSYSVVAASGSTQTYTDQAVNGTDVCPANMGATTTSTFKVSCVKFSSESVAMPTGATLTGVGSFGPANAIGGAFTTQGTDVFDGARVPGMVVTYKGQPAHWAYREMKLTTAATLQPLVATAACVDNVMQVAGQHVTRAHVLVGPVIVPD